MSNSARPDEDFLKFSRSDQHLFLEGPAGCGKTTAAVSHLFKLIADGVPGGSILVLTPQRTLGFAFEQALRSPETGDGGLPALMTAAGLARRMVDLFWPLAAANAGFSAPEEPPIFLTLETAQYYMAHLVRPLLEERRLFDSVVIDRNRIYSQILDSLNKSAVVGFPHTEIAGKLKSAWIGAPSQLHIYDDVQICVDAFRTFCLEHNLLDFSLQIHIFRDYLWQEPVCRDYLLRNYRHLIADNLEEETPFAHDLLLEWLPEFESAFLIYDWQAGYRRFLGADPRSAYRLKQACSEHITFKEPWDQSAHIQGLHRKLNRVFAIADQPYFLFSDRAETMLEGHSEKPDSLVGETLESRSQLQSLLPRYVELGG